MTVSHAAIERNSMGPTVDQTLLALTAITPDADAIVQIERVRTAAKNFALTIHREVPSSPERSTALTHLRTATMFAIQSCVLESTLRNPDVPQADKRGNVLGFQPPLA